MHAYAELIHNLLVVSQAVTFSYYIYNLYLIPNKERKMSFVMVIFFSQDYTSTYITSYNSENKEQVETIFYKQILDESNGWSIMGKPLYLDGAI